MEEIQKQQNTQVQDVQFLKTKLLLGVSGSVATIKLETLLEQFLATKNYEIKVITTDKASEFFDREALTQKFGNQLEILDDRNEWGQWKKKGDPVLHIELRKWADIFVIAPLSANTLAKMANLFCDNLLTCVARAWDFKKFHQQGKVHTVTFQSQKDVQILQKPFIVAPAMNTLMFDHPGTIGQIQILRSWGIIVMDTVEKLLACNDYGKGAMAEPQTIVELVENINKLIKYQ